MTRVARALFRVVPVAGLFLLNFNLLAQEARTSIVTPPAERMAISPGGVDMRTGQYAFSQTDVSIGDSNGLAFTRTQMVPLPETYWSPFPYLGHNWHIMITEQKIRIETREYKHNPNFPDYRVSVRWPGRVETFESRSVDTGFSHTSNTSLARLTVEGDRASTGALYTYEGMDGTIMKFRPMGSGDCGAVGRCAYISEKIDPDGTRFAFEYDNPGGQPGETRLRSVVSSRGYALLLEYPATGVQPSKVCALNLAVTVKPGNNVCPAGAPSATYSGGSTTDASGATWTIGNDVNGHFGIIPPGQNTASMRWGITLRRNQEDAWVPITDYQIFSTGEAYYYEYDSPPSITGSIEQIAGGRWTDAAGNVTVVRYGFPDLPRSMGPPQNPFFPDPILYQNSFQGIQITPGPVEIIDPLNRKWTRNYCDPVIEAGLPASDTLHRCVVSDLQYFDDPEGARTYVEHDGAGNITRMEQRAKPSSTLPPIILSANYNCGFAKTCSKPARLVDANGNVTDNTFSPVHGGILTSTLPPLPNGVRPQTRYDYAQRTVWILNPAGGFMPAGSPVWVLVSESTCRTSAATGNPSSPCAGGASDEVRTLYDYGPDSGPNNLWLRGVAVVADGQTLRTCYQYDQRGRRIAETKPLGTGATCP